MKIAVVMVGLPASGKSFTARNILRYLRWIGVTAQMFRVADYRARIVGPHVTAEFFDSSNEENLAIRTRIAKEALDDMLKWLSSSIDEDSNQNTMEQQSTCEMSSKQSVLSEASVGVYDVDRVAILDASNTRMEWRAIIRRQCLLADVLPLFVECIYTDHAMMVPVHIRELRQASPEYAGRDRQSIFDDYNRRIEYYRPYYVTIAEEERQLLNSTGASEVEVSEELDAKTTLLKTARLTVIDGGERVIAARVFGYLPSRILFYLMNGRSITKSVFLASLPPNPADLEQRAVEIHNSLGLCQLEESFSTINTDSSAVDFSSTSCTILDSRDEEYSESVRISESAHMCVQSRPGSTVPVDHQSNGRLTPPHSEDSIPFAVWTETSRVCDVLGRVFHGHALQAKPQLRPLESVLSVSTGDLQDIAMLVGEEERNLFADNPFKYRISSSAESYHDLAMRLENVILELERSSNDVLVIAHPTVLRLIYAYFTADDGDLIDNGCDASTNENSPLVNWRCNDTSVLDAAVLSLMPFPHQIIQLTKRSGGVSEHRMDIAPLL